MPELILSLKDRELSRHALGDQSRVGRDPDSDILIDNVGVSRHHATIIRDGTTFVVRDEGSANGLHVNGQRVTAHSLRDGDTVQIGKFSLQLNMAGSGGPSMTLTPSRSLPPARDMAKTLALAPMEVQSLIAAQQAAKRAPAPGEPEPDNSIRILLLGLLVIAALAAASYFVLID